MTIAAIVAGLAHPLASSMASAASDDRAVVQFDIPAQSLEDALYTFGVATGIEIVVDGSNVAGRQSKAVKGALTPAQALRALLAGTGLDASRIGRDAITLLPGKPSAMDTSLAYRDYSALVQTAVVRGLCAEQDTRPGSYRIAAQLWLGPTGMISSANLLSSTGDPMRDSRLQQIFAGISIGRAPPPTLPQPLIMVILPRSPQDSGDCN